MRFDYTPTFDDFAEAHKLNGQPRRDRPLSLRERLLFLWVFVATIVLFVFVLVGEVVVAIVASGGRATRAEAWVTNLLVQGLVPTMPWLLIMGILWYAMAPRLHAGERVAYRRFLLIVVAMVPIVVVLTSLLGGSGAAAAAPEPDAGESASALAWLPWLGMFGVLSVLIVHYLRGAPRRAWDAQQRWAGQPTTLETGDHGLRFTTPHASNDYRWSAFQLFREGPTIFMLYTGLTQFEMIPKRAMAGDAEVEAFRRLLEAHVLAADPRPQGFPLAAAAPSPPAPAVPPPPPATAVAQSGDATRTSHEPWGTERPE